VGRRAAWSGWVRPQKASIFFEGGFGLVDSVGVVEPEQEDVVVATGLDPGAEEVQVPREDKVDDEFVLAGAVPEQETFIDVASLGWKNGERVISRGDEGNYSQNLHFFDK